MVTAKAPVENSCHWQIDRRTDRQSEMIMVYPAAASGRQTDETPKEHAIEPLYMECQP